MVQVIFLCFDQMIKFIYHYLSLTFILVNDDYLFLLLLSGKVKNKRLNEKKKFYLWDFFSLASYQIISFHVTDF